MKTRHRLLLIGSLLPVAIAAAQNNSNLAELTKLHANLNKPGTIVTPDQARMASGRLDEWKLDAAALSGGSKRELLAVQVLIAAAMGDQWGRWLNTRAGPCCSATRKRPSPSRPH